MTLLELKSIQKFVNVRAIASELMIPGDTLHTRLRRGKPDLLVLEQAALDDIFQPAGLIPARLIKLPAEAP